MQRRSKLISFVARSWVRGRHIKEEREGLRGILDYDDDIATIVEGRGSVDEADLVLWFLPLVVKEVD